MNTPWFHMMFSHDHFRKILCAFHIVDNSVIPARNDTSYRPSVRLRLLLDYMNNICMHYFSPGQAVAIDENLVAGKYVILFDSTFGLNTMQGLEQKSS